MDKSKSVNISVAPSGVVYLHNGEALLHRLVLLLSALLPVFMILGNIYPPVFGVMSIHHAVNGFLVLVSAFSLIRREPFFFIGLLGLAFAQFLNYGQNPLALLADHYGGIILFYTLSSWFLCPGRDFGLYIRIFLIASLIPLILSVLQYFGYLPVEVGYRRNINITYFEGEEIVRVNGFLYFVQELFVVLFIVYLLSALHLRRRFWLVLGGFMTLAVLYKLKAGAAYAGFVVILSLFVRVRNLLLRYLLLSLGLMGALYFVAQTPSLRDFFDIERIGDPARKDELFSGRYAIWQVYLNIFGEGNIGGKLFGMGNYAHEVFSEIAKKLYGQKDIVAGAHNQAVEMLVNTGVFGIFLHIYLLIKALRYVKMRIQRPYYRNLQIYFWTSALFLGLTAPLWSTFYFWVGLFFIAYYCFLESLFRLRPAQVNQVAGCTLK